MEVLQKCLGSWANWVEHPNQIAKVTQVQPMSARRWFTLHCFFSYVVFYTFDHSVKTVRQAALEHEAIDEVCEKFGVEAKEIIRVLEEGEQHDPLAIAYKLIIDNKRIENEEAISEFK